MVCDLATACAKVYNKKIRTDIMKVTAAYQFLYGKKVGNTKFTNWYVYFIKKNVPKK